MAGIRCIGDVFIDTFLKLTEAGGDSVLDKSADRLCLRYGDKIPVEDLERSLGGSAPNVAVGLARSGTEVELFSAVGDDDDGYALRVLEGEGVSTRLVRRSADEANNRSFILNFQGERTILAHHRPRTYRMPEGGWPEWVYLAPSGQNFEALSAGIANLAKVGAFTLGYNPSTLELAEGVGHLKPLFEAAGVLFVNREEARQLIDPDEGDSAPDPRALLDGLSRWTQGTIVITDGPNGAYAHGPDADLFLEAWPAPLVERTGAGDGFATGFIAGRMHGLSVAESLRWAAVDAASVLGHVGGQAGLLTRDAIESTLARAPEFQPRPFD